MKPKFLKITFNLLFVVICTIGITKLQRQQLKTAENEITEREYFDIEKAKKAQLSILKKIPNFGFSNLIADWSYLQFLQYFGDEKARETTGYSLSPDYFETVVNHDPRFVRAYFLLSPATSLFAGEPQKTIDLISQGLKSVSSNTSPEAYYLWIYKANDEMLFLGNTEAAKKSYEMASAWAEQSDLPTAKNSAANTKRTAKFLEDNPKSSIARVSAWTMVLSSSPDAKTQQKAIKNIEDLGGEIVVSPEGRINVKVPEES